MKKTLSLLLCLILAVSPTLNQAQEQPITPTVAVSITPFYALVAAVMQGIATPHLLIKPGASPHQYALKSSDIQHLKEADLIFWGGGQLETFLVKPLRIVLQKKTPPLIIELAKTPDLLLLPLRSTPEWEPHTHDHPGGLDADVDMHFWLDPQNGIILTNYIVLNLIKIDPNHAEQYQQNGEILTQRLKKLDADIQAKLKPIHSIPFVVFHDAYQYFERRYDLNAVGAITLHPELPPSAKRVKIIREAIIKSHAQCVFTEPQFEPKLVHNIVKDLNIRVDELDPEGQAALANPNGYFELLDNLSQHFQRCLS